MKEQKQREDYPNSYEWRRETLFREIYDNDDIEGKYPNIISFFVKSGRTPVSGKEAEIKPVEFVKEVCIKEAFQQIQAVMTTKNKQLRASMKSLQPWQEYDLIALLTYLREEWGNGNRGTVLLSWKEYFLLKEGGFKKPKNKKK